MSIFETTVYNIGDFFKAFDRVVGGLDTQKSYTVFTEFKSAYTISKGIHNFTTKENFVDTNELIRFIAREIINNYYDGKDNQDIEFAVYSQPMKFVFKGVKGKPVSWAEEEFAITFTVLETPPTEIQAKLERDLNKFYENALDQFSFIRDDTTDQLYAVWEDGENKVIYKVVPNTEKHSRLDADYRMEQVEKIGK